jgi:hypothetical protein
LLPKCHFETDCQQLHLATKNLSHWRYRSKAEVFQRNPPGKELDLIVPEPLRIITPKVHPKAKNNSFQPTKVAPVFKLPRVHMQLEDRVGRAQSV